MKNVFFYLFLFYSASSFAQEKLAPSNVPGLTIQNNPPVCVVCDTCVYDLVAIQMQPGFPGGDKALTEFISKNTTYPTLAKENSVQGKVFVTFIIDKTGDVTNVNLYKGVNKKPKQQTIPNSTDSLNEKKLALYAEGAKQLDEEALRVVRLLPKWSPGKQNDKAVRVRYILPFVFKLT